MFVHDQRGNNIALYNCSSAITSYDIYQFHFQLLQKRPFECAVSQADKEVCFTLIKELKERTSLFLICISWFKRKSMPLHMYNRSPLSITALKSFPAFQTNQQGVQSRQHKSPASPVKQPIFSAFRMCASVVFPSKWWLCQPIAGSAPVIARSTKPGTWEKVIRQIILPSRSF